MSKIFRIIVADDDIDDQDLIRRSFRDSKVQVEVNSVYNGLQLMDYLLRKEAYRNITDPLPDLIMLDLNMPLMDGFDVLQQIKKHPGLLNIPIYVLTTSRNPDHKKKALELGATGFYSKGASSKEIRRIVQEVCIDCFSSMM
jgi:CheY-like chemotaxis protein